MRQLSWYTSSAGNVSQASHRTKTKGHTSWMRPAASFNGAAIWKGNPREYLSLKGKPGRDCYCFCFTYFSSNAYGHT